MKILNDVLKEILSNKSSRMETVKRFQQIVFDSESNFYPSLEIEDLYRTLAYDLEFYKSNEILRMENINYYGDERLEKEIKDVLNR